MPKPSRAIRRRAEPPSWRAIVEDLRERFRSNRVARWNEYHACDEDTGEHHVTARAGDVRIPCITVWHPVDCDCPEVARAEPVPELPAPWIIRRMRGEQVS